MYIIFIYSLLWASSLVAVTQLKKICKHTIPSMNEVNIPFTLYYVKCQSFLLFSCNFIPLPFLFPSQNTIPSNAKDVIESVKYIIF